MTLEEIKTYLEENKDSEDVKAFLGTLSKTEITLGAVQKYLTDKQDGKDWLSQQKETEADRRATKAVETFKEKTMPGLVEEAVKKAKPDETPEQKRIRQLEDDMANGKKELERERLKTAALSKMNEEKLPVEMVDYLIGITKEETDANIEKYKAIHEASVKSSVESKFKDNGGKPGGDADNGDIKVNPWKKETRNLTQQGKILRDNPDLAKKLKLAAGL